MEKELDEIKKFGFDAVREKWNHMSYDTMWAPRLYKVIAAVVVAISTYLLMEYGLTFKISWLKNLLGMFPNVPDNISLIVAVANGLISLVTAKIGIVVNMVVIGSSISGLAPVVFLIALAIMFTMFSNSNAVVAAMSILPLALLNIPAEIMAKKGLTSPLFSLEFGIFIMAFIIYASLRLDGKLQSITTPIMFGLFSVGFSTFAKFSKISYKHSYWTIEKIYSETEGKNVDNTTFTENANAPIDANLNNIVIICAIILVISVIFMLVVNLKNERYSKLNIDVRDGIAFAVFTILLIVGFSLIPKYTPSHIEWKINYLSVIIQVALAYLITRPIARRAPNKYMSQEYGGDRGFIFISYAHSDIKKVVPYMKELEKRGYAFWYDSQIKAGSEWQDVIASNLAKSSFFLSFISSSSVNSDYCLKEINYATSKNKPIAAIILDDAQLPPVLEMHLASMQAVDARKNSYEQCIDEIVKIEGIEKCVDYGLQN